MFGVKGVALFGVKSVAVFGVKGVALCSVLRVLLCVFGVKGVARAKSFTPTTQSVRPHSSPPTDDNLETLYHML